MTEAPGSRKAPEAGETAIQDADATSVVQLTAAEVARFVMVTVAVVVAPKAQDSEDAAGNTSSGDETVNTRGTAS